jgi:hypothetical protein
MWSPKKWSIQGLAEGVKRLDQNNTKIVVRPDNKYFYKGQPSGAVTLRYLLEDGHTVMLRFFRDKNVLRLEGMNDGSTQPLYLNNEKIKVNEEGYFKLSVPLRRQKANFQWGLGSQ